MPALSDYVTGTISLTNGSVDFTGTSTGWLLAGFKEGDTIIDITGATEYMGVVATIDANGAGTLTKAWEGPTLVDVAYRMRFQPDGARVSAQARNLIELLGNGRLVAIAGAPGTAGVIEILPGGTAVLVPKTDLVSGVNYDVQVDLLADRDAYDGQAEGFSVLVADVGDGRAAVYAKNSATSGDWSDPAYVTGPIGPAPVFTVDDTTTLAPSAAATFALTPTIDGYEIDIGIPAGRGLTPLGDYNPATAYVLDDATLYNGSTWIALGPTTGNAPPTLPATSNAYWQLLARQGIDGAGTVNSIVAGDGIAVDNSDPTAPVVSAPRAADVPARGHISGLEVSRSEADASNDLIIAKGEAESDSANSILLRLASNLLKRHDAAWSVGSGGGSLDQGSAADGWVYVFLIGNSATGAVDVLTSAKADNPALPAGWDHKRLIWAVLRESAATRPFTQEGDLCLWDDVSSDISVATFGTTPTSFALKVPPIAKVFAIINAFFYKTSAGVVGHLYSPLVSDQTAAFSDGNSNLGTLQAGNNSASSVQLVIPTLASNIRGIASAADCNLIVGTVGFRLDRSALYADETSIGMVSDRLVGAGDSIMVGSGASIPDNNWWNTYYRATAPLSRESNAVGGACAGDQSGELIGFAPRPSDTALVSVGANDATHYGGGATELAYFEGALIDICAKLSILNRKTARGGQLTLTGTWTDTGVSSEGKQSTVLGSKAVGSVNGTAVYIGLILLDSGSADALISVKIDGVTVSASLSTSGVAGAGVTTDLGTTYINYAIRYGGLSAGDHTVEVELLTSGETLFLEYIAGSGQRLYPQVFLANVLKQIAGASDAVTGDYAIAAEAVATDMASDGLRVSVVDIRSALGPGDMADDKHPNDAGHAKIAAEFLAAL